MSTILTHFKQVKKSQDVTGLKEHSNVRKFPNLIW